MGKVDDVLLLIHILVPRTYGTAAATTRNIDRCRIPPLIPNDGAAAVKAKSYFIFLQQHIVFLYATERVADAITTRSPQQQAEMHMPGVVTVQATDILR